MLHQSPDRALKIKKIVLEIDKKNFLPENVQKKQQILKQRSHNLESRMMIF